MDKKSFPLKTQSYIANAIYIAVAFIINANNNSNFVLFLSITFYPITFYPITFYPITFYPITFYPITFYPITIQTLTIMIIVHIVKSEGEGALTHKR
uniref:Uncharacterized protein n=1 Tax=Escherichia coli TaxID=562 RepID=A0A6D1P393_ECOLX|nr:hypothetical protein AFAJKIAJ_00158 [Escherichia coli]